MNRPLVASIGALITIATVGVASWWPWYGWWAFCHLAYLGLDWWLAFAVVAPTVVILAYTPDCRRPEAAALPRRLTCLAFGSNRAALGVAGATALAGLVLAADTHFLGDGYGWLSILGRGEPYVHKWTEVGSIFIIRSLQSFLGGYTRVTAQAVFQLLSVVSGAITVFNFFGIVRHTVRKPDSRLLALTTLLCSGSLLLFFGYVEFYPLLWAAGTTYLHLALRLIRIERGLVWVILAFAASALMHLQALYLLPGLLLLIRYRLFRGEDGWRLKRSHYLMAGIAGILLVAGLATAAALSLKVQLIFLPLFDGRPPTPDYAMFTLDHWQDIINQMFLILPGLLMLLPMLGRPTTRLTEDKAALFLVASAIGAVAFLVSVDPVIGMARDWDLFSFTLLPVGLLLLWLIDHTVQSIPRPVLASYALVTALATASYLGVNLNRVPSESRFHRLLEHYGNKDRSGWVIYANYFRDTGDLDSYSAIVKQSNRYFPEHRTLKGVHKLLDRQRLGPALKLARELVDKQPYTTEFLQVLGAVHGDLRQYDSAEYYYRRALTIKPSMASLNLELGHVYLDQKKYDQALVHLKRAHAIEPGVFHVVESIGLAHLNMGRSNRSLEWADTLFASDPNSSGGHLLYMIVAIRDGDMATAEKHFEQFKLYGAERVDYATLLEYYGPMLSEHR